MMNELLNRNDFRNSVFTRDKYQCVMCKEKGQDAHHIIERRLWNDGGYYLNNGATLCGGCHIKAEHTILSCEDIRKACGIEKIILPEHLYDEFSYDKWGNIINPNGTRIKGELFFDESVQKILKEGNVLHSFDFRIKHPRTHHLPWSESITEDDKIIYNLDTFKNKEIVITEKLDGEQTNCYSNGYCHARSLETDNHYTNHWVKNLCSQIYLNIPEDWRVCGENLAYEHSIHYNNLETYFYVHSIWNEKNVCLSYDETILYSELLGLKMVPLLYRGMFESFNNEAFKWKQDNRDVEGYVLRTADEIHFSQFKNCVGKYVRKNHVNTVQHWRKGHLLKPNELIKVSE